MGSWIAYGGIPFSLLVINNVVEILQMAGKDDSFDLTKFLGYLISGSILIL
jgi:hypothetical protein